MATRGLSDGAWRPSSVELAETSRNFSFVLFLVSWKLFLLSGVGLFPGLMDALGQQQRCGRGRDTLAGPPQETIWSLAGTGTR